MRSVDQPTHHVTRASPRAAGKLLTAAAVVAAITVVTVAVASANTGDHENGRVIHLRSTLVSATVNSADQNGPGNVVANLFSFTTSTGTTGHADISCTLFPNAEQLCYASFVFPDGQIDAEAAISLPPTIFDAAVIGGTGAYIGASGQVHNVVVAPGVIDRTITLLRTDD
jgi:hypothetical protein